ncbi:MAG: VCBS repeat-containing protein [Candidatus Hydrogenedentes bacterium]|nr:VCBS repeat-containing protein [Candidatus Hydrogenedentota bacterium]
MMKSPLQRTIAAACISPIWIAAFFLLTGMITATAQKVPPTFAMPSQYYHVGPNPNAIAAADLTGNGLPDIVTVDRGELHDPREERPANDEASLLLAELPFDYIRRHPSLKTGFGPYAIALSNVDGLKWPDIIIANFHAARHRNLSVFLNLKDDGVFKALEFEMPENLLSYHRHYDGEDMPMYTQPGLTAVAIRDLNNDGLRDLIATGWSSDVLVFMPGHEEKVFDAPRFMPAPGGPREFSLTHLDDDDLLDLAVVMYATSEITLFKGDDTGNFTEYDRFSSRGALPTTLQTGDINGDGKIDIITSHAHTDDSIVIFYGDKPFLFPLSQEIMLGEDRGVLEHEIRDIIVADMNNNGRLDIVAACYASRKITVLFNESKDNKLPQHFRRESYTFTDSRPRALWVADFDTDQRPDIAVALWESNTVGIMRNIR